MSDIDRQRKRRRRLKEEGWVRVELIVPKRFKARLKRYESLIKDKLVKEKQGDKEANR